MQIVNLSRVPEYLPLIAEWIYDAFWQDSGQSITVIQGLLEDHLLGKPIPTTLVAIEDDRPIGSVCFIESDMAERPHLTPWLAALYVLPAYRQRGVGSQLVTQLVHYAKKAGFNRIYLSADDQISLYEGLGFEIVETDVGPHRLTIMQQLFKKGEQE